MIAWSIVSGSMAFLHSPVTFLVLRMLLGVAEAGFYPGVIFYLTLWLPRRVRSSYLAWFIFAVPLANIFGGPLSSWILAHGHIGRFANWQVLLLTEAAPALLLGALLPWVMTDSPAQAQWLSPRERALLLQARADDEPPTAADPASRRFDIGSLRHILLFAAIYFTMQFGIYAQSFWLPKILANMGVATRAIGWHIALVYLGAMAIMLAWALFADRAPTRRWTLAVPLAISAVGYAATSLSSHIAAGTLAIVVVMIAFGLGGAGELAATPPFWAQVTLGQRPTAVAGMIAVINALGNIGGFAGPSTLGWLQQYAGGYSAGMLSVGAAILVGVVLLYAAHPQRG
jgi:MFS family permease